MMKETSIAAAISTALTTGVGYVGIDKFLVERIDSNKSEIVIAKDKADSGNLVTQRLISDRIKDLRRQQAATKDPAEKASIEDRIKEYQDKAKDLDAKILK